MDQKKLYTIHWTQPYNLTQVTLTELEGILDMCIEAMIEQGDLTEARQELDRIMKL